MDTLEKTAALVVIDLQAGIVAVEADPGVPSAADVVRRTADLATAFRSSGRPVVLVTVDGVPPGRTDASRGQSARTFPDGWDRLVPELDTDPDDLRILKRAWGAFTGTGLDAQLRERGITQVVLTGIATSKGVESTARSAHELGYDVALVADAMTDRDPGDHQHSLTRIFPALGEVTSTAEVTGLVREV